MVVGQAGARGRFVINPAEQVCKSVLGAARNRLQVMAGKPAMDIRGKVVSATHTCALVRTSLWLNACGLLCFIFLMEKTRTGRH